MDTKTNTNTKNNRRLFLKTITATALSVPLLIKQSGSLIASALAEVKGRIDPKSSMATGKKYVDVSTTPGQNCANCKWYTVAKKVTEGGEEYAPCSMLGNKMVPSKGWCSSYKAKT